MFTRRMIASVIFVFIISIFLMNSNGIWVVIFLLCVTGLCVILFNRTVGKYILALAMLPLMVYIASTTLPSVSAMLHKSSQKTAAHVDTPKSPQNNPSPEITQNTPTIMTSPDINKNEDSPKIVFPSSNDHERNTRTGDIVIPEPIAPARPSEANEVVAEAKTSKVVLSHDASNACASLNTKNPNIDEGFRSGDVYVTLYECNVEGNRLHFSGAVRYVGNSETPISVSFGQIIVSDSPQGRVHSVEKGTFGTSRSFGTSYSQQFVDSSASIRFSFYAGLIDASEDTVTISIPALIDNAHCHINFKDVKLQS